jgi:uncharacterized protein YyaL (SSP411 family)
MPRRSLLPLALFLCAAPIVADEKPKPPAAVKPTTFTNRLAKEKSPYLLQHQHNPVDWYPWGPAAFEKARKENKPIFLSVGYSTCHWCHVMAHESFENDEIAKVLNEHFVPVKVDREERPDVDKVYMTFVQASTGGGGWPMSVWLTPDLKPFVGGTYFPPQDRGGRRGFKTVLLQIAKGWKEDHDNIIKAGDDVAKQLAEFAAGGPPSQTELSAQAVLASGQEQLTRRFDDEQGGFGDAPKFPQPSMIHFLLRMALKKGEGDKAELAARNAAQARKMALFTLEKMAAGGIHDHLGGGFHRYSVDTYWHIPHFEKMLYDQAQLSRAYTDAFALTRDARWERVARDVFDYVLRDLTSKEGGFYSAEDADSILEHGKPEHGEGAFYVWTKAEIEAALGEAAPIFNRVYGVEAEGNAPMGSDPLGELKGKNTLIRRMTSADAAKFFKKDEAEIERTLADARKTLFERRAKRPRPHLDDKIITGWNGLMISAFARAAQVFDEPRYLTAAQASARFIKAQLWKDGALIRSHRHEPSGVPGFADDYAALIAGLLDLYEADFDSAHLEWALQLQAKMDALFYDKAHGGYFQTAPAQGDILFRSKEDYDGAEPAPGSLAAGNLLRLAQLTDSAELRERAEKTIRSTGDKLDKLPSALTQLLCAVDFSLAKPRQIVIAGKPGADDTRALLREVHAVFAPNQVVLLADGAAGQEWLGKKIEVIRTMKPLAGKAAVYVCENYTCQQPVSDPAELRKMFGR